MKNTTIIAALLLIAINTQAQKLKEGQFGFAVALNYPVYQNNFPDLYRYMQPFGSFASKLNHKLSFAVSGSYEIAFTKVFGARAGLGFEVRRFTIGPNNDPDLHKQTYYNINIPLLAQINTGDHFGFEVGVEVNPQIGENHDEESEGYEPKGVITPVEFVGYGGMRFRFTDNIGAYLGVRFGLNPATTFSGTYGFEDQFLVSGLEYRLRALTVGATYLIGN